MIYLRLEVWAPTIGPYSRVSRGILGTLKGSYRVYSRYVRIPRFKGPC